MPSPRFSFEEFKSLFPDRCRSEEELHQEYESFLATWQQLEKMPIPRLTAGEKVEIFEQAWEGSRQKFTTNSWLGNWIPKWMRTPALTFVFGVVVGCILTFLFTTGQFELVQTAAASPPLTVVQTRITQTYQGKIINEMYPLIENPKIVLESRRSSSQLQRVVYGTLDAGDIYVVLNL